MSYQMTAQIMVITSRGLEFDSEIKVAGENMAACVKQVWDWFSGALSPEEMEGIEWGWHANKGFATAAVESIDDQIAKTNRS